MRIVNMLKNRRYLGIAVLSALGIGLFLPLVQTGLKPDNMLAWYLTLVDRPLNTGLYVIFSVLFGVLVALQLYNKHICKTCNVKTDSKKASTFGGTGAVLGFALGVCPACIGLIGLLLPLTVSITLTNYNWLFMSIAIAIMFVSIKFLGGLDKK